MSDGAPPSDPDDSGSSGEGSVSSAPGDERDATTYLYWGAFATLLALALLATVRFYLSASRTIEIWVAPDFAPAFQAAFNLAVVLACAVGLSLLVRRMRV